MRGKFLVYFLLLGIAVGGEIGTIGKRLKIFYETGNKPAFEVEKNRLLDLMAFRDRKYARGVSELLLPLASERRDLSTIGFLKKIDGENYRIYLEEGRIFLGQAKIRKALGCFWTSFIKFVNTPFGMSYSAFLFTRMIVLVFIVMLLFLSLSLLFWFTPLFLHDLKEFTGRSFAGWLLMIAAFVVPLILLPGFGFLVFYIPALLSIYIDDIFSRRLLVMALLFAIFSMVIPKEGKFKPPAQAKVMERLMYYDEDQETLQQAEKLLANNWDEDLAFYLAHTYENLGELGKAVELYKKIIKKNPAHVRALVSLAHIRFLSREIPISLSLLNKAVNAKKREIIPLHDLSYVLEQIGRINQSAKYSSMGWKLHGRAWDRFSKKNPGFVVYGFQSEDIFWKYFGKLTTAHNFPPRSLAIAYIFSRPVVVSPLIIGFLLLLIVLYIKEKLPVNMGSAIYCKGCEKPICERCSKYYYKGYCNECMDRIELTGGDTSSSMSFKVIRVRNVRRIPREILQEFINFLYPGASLFKEGKLYPSLFSFVFVYMLSLFLFGLKTGFPLFFHFFILAFIFYVVSVIYLYINEWRL